ncbi:NAD(P)-binding protein [Periconia macrospinosa]|uniref:3beta-hydroxysteroid 3-dehydrogenase n=1 Tax=Periconia macrospinosa TaxID=97972 RepID=A0A2V1DTF4_9PLEO|nr:NAD(P)-binding protein [Periconia macrospinosa]
MEGTVLITGGNGSLAIPAVERLLSKYPTYTVIATVRDDTKKDTNTERLLQVIAKYPGAKCQLRKLDLSRMSEVATFADTLHSDIASARIPSLTAIICNAMTWSLADGIKLTPDGIETSLAINHLAHFNLVLRLLGNLKEAKDGRIVFLGSDAHANPGFGGLKPELPSDLEHLAHPPPDKKGQEASKGFYRYGISKLATIMTAHELDRKLHQDPELKNISVLTVDPGGLLDSRAFSQKDVPRLWSTIIRVVGWMYPIIKYVLPQMRFTAAAAAELVGFALDPEHAGKCGYYEVGKLSASSVASQDEKLQVELWKKSIGWCGIEQRDSALRLGSS